MNYLSGLSEISELNESDSCSQYTFYNYLENIQYENNFEESVENIFLKLYPFVFDILPNKILTNKQIKLLLQSNSNINYLDYALFKNVWLNYFKWKLNQNYKDTKFIIGR